jgi:hypothetical protein
MIYRYFFFIALIFVCFLPAVRADTMGKNDLVGCWVRSYTEPYPELLTKLCINDEFETHWYSEAETTAYISSEHQYTDDIFIATYRKNGEVGSRIVLGGWTQEERAAIFGTVYIYHEGHLINGIPITLNDSGWAQEIANRPWWDSCALQVMSWFQ